MERLRATATTIRYQAWDAIAGQWKTGDATNHTLRWRKDGGSLSVLASPSIFEDATFPGTYAVALNSSETDCISGLLQGKSSTAGIAIVPVSVDFKTSTVMLDGSQPNYAPAVAGDAMTLTSGERGAVRAGGQEVSVTLMSGDVVNQIRDALEEPLTLSIDGFTGNALSQLRALPVVTTTPVTQEKLVTLLAGDDYYQADGRALEFVNSSQTWPDLAGAELSLIIENGTSELTIEGEAGVTGWEQWVRFEMGRNQTAGLMGLYDYSVWAELGNGHEVTLVQGKFKVNPGAGV